MSFSKTSEIILPNTTSEGSGEMTGSNFTYVSRNRWPAPLGHLEEFITSTGHDLTVDHSKDERIEEKFAELQQKMSVEKNESPPPGMIARFGKLYKKIRQDFGDLLIDPYTSNVLPTVELRLPTSSFWISPLQQAPR